MGIFIQHILEASFSIKNYEMNSVHKLS